MCDETLYLWEKLNGNLTRTVREYHRDVVILPEAIEELIGGTAFFPGGSGLWRGLEAGGPLPKTFPVRSLMFLGHNFDSVRAFQRARAMGGEAQSPFWATLRAVLKEAGVDLSDCFFTNALMGLQPGKSTGPMPSTPMYKRQCSTFLYRQIEIVAPRALITLGVPAAKFASGMSLGIPSQPLSHPGALIYVQGAHRPAWIRRQAELLSAFVTNLPSS